jgi:hypothetical protein
MDVDTLIRAAGGSERRALEDTLAKLISTVREKKTQP